MGCSDVHSEADIKVRCSEVHSDAHIRVHCSEVHSEAHIRVRCSDVHSEAHITVWGWGLHLCSLKELTPYLCVVSFSRFFGRLMIWMASKGHFCEGRPAAQCVLPCCNSPVSPKTFRRHLAY